ncbi:MAG TPA: hypothetical protein VFB34_03060 [Chloroflexota bacterium]|nr:hypothetical protein [Chloroflexota bacterium]
MADSTALGFERDIKPLFRPEDREAMEFIFDLWDHQDVSDNADSILERVEDGTMPCDTRWSEEQIQLLRRWIAAGRPE